MNMCLQGQNDEDIKTMWVTAHGLQAHHEHAAGQQAITAAVVVECLLLLLLLPAAVLVAHQSMWQCRGHTPGLLARNLHIQ
jgi:hypothetical protein